MASSEQQQQQQSLPDYRQQEEKVEQVETLSGSLQEVMTIQT